MTESIVPEPIPDDEALRRLREFLGHVESLLSELTFTNSALISGRHHQAMRAAWAQVQPQFAILIKDLRRPAAAKHIKQLRSVGLLGDQLVFKLSVFQQANDELRDYTARTTALDKKGAEQGGWLKGGWRSVLRKLCKRTLKAADVILGSLAKALPLSPCEVIKEFKEGAESGLELGEAVREVVDPSLRTEVEV